MSVRRPGASEASRSDSSERRSSTSFATTDVCRFNCATLWLRAASTARCRRQLVACRIEAEIQTLTGPCFERKRRRPRTVSRVPPHPLFAEPIWSCCPDKQATTNEPAWTPRSEVEVDLPSHALGARAERRRAVTATTADPVAYQLDVRGKATVGGRSLRAKCKWLAFAVGNYDEGRAP